MLLKVNSFEESSRNGRNISCIKETPCKMTDREIDLDATNGKSDS